MFTLAMTGRHTTEAFLGFRCLDTFASVLALFAAFALATWRQVSAFHTQTLTTLVCPALVSSVVSSQARLHFVLGLLGCKSGR